MATYTNRYGDQFTFTKDEDGNILWEGNFGYCRVGFPNDYTKAYAEYVNDGGLLSLEEFKVKVHEWDDENKVHVLGYKYASMVESLKDQLNMVDPSGGPYIARDFPMDLFGDEFKGMIVKDFQWIKTGYKIIVK